MNSHPQRVTIKRTRTSTLSPQLGLLTPVMAIRKLNFSILSLTSDLFMTFYRVILYARMVFLLLLYTLATTSVGTQSHIWKFKVLPRTTPAMVCFN